MGQKKTSETPLLIYFYPFYFLLIECDFETSAKTHKLFVFTYYIYISIKNIAYFETVKIFYFDI